MIGTQRAVIMDGRTDGIVIYRGRFAPNGEWLSNTTSYVGNTLVGAFDGGVHTLIF